MKQLKMKKQLLLWCLVVVCLTGCQQDDIVPVEPEATPTEVIHVSKQSPWQKVRYDYSYLTPEKVEEANHYLTHEHLTREDLEQIQEIGTMIFGDYMQTLVTDFDHRTPDMMDDELFYAEEVKKRVYGSLIGNFFTPEKKGENILNAPHIRPNTKHIGDRNGYIFVPMQVYRKGVPAAGPDMPAEMVYYVLQLKRDTTSKYGWKIYFIEQFAAYNIAGYEIWSNHPWTIMFNETDDFSSGTLPLMVPSEERWRYYVGEEDRDDRYDIPTQIQHQNHAIPSSNARSSSLYNNRAAASYSYNHALADDYNSYYRSWSQDCANFASQCLTAGGLPHDNRWYYRKRGWDRYSNEWIRVNELYKYLLETGRGEIVAAQHMPNTYDYDSGAWCSLEWGDLVFMNGTLPGNSNPPRLTNQNGDKVVNRLTHVMVVTHSYNNPSPPHYYGDRHGEPRYKLSGHTTNMRDLPLTDIYDTDWWREHSIGMKIIY